MLNLMVLDEMDSFRDQFDIALKEKASLQMHDMSKDVSKDLFKDAQTNEDYGRTGINTGVYNFDDEDGAKKFFESAVNSGISKKDLNLEGTGVRVGDIADADMEETLYELAKQMNASFTEENNSFASIVGAILSENTDMLVHSKDDTKIKLTPSTIKNVVNLHDNLSLENQKILRDNIFESKASFDRIVKFATEYSRGN
jgi:uncharacterized glyoxalase superfamily protein PhnB